MNDFTNIRYETVEEDRTLSALDLSPAEGKSDRDMRDGMDCNYPDCGCCFDSKCSDAPDAAPSNPVISDEMVERVFQSVAPFIEGTAWREVRAAITAALSVKPQSGENG